MNSTKCSFLKDILYRHCSLLQDADRFLSSTVNFGWTYFLSICLCLFILLVFITVIQVGLLDAIPVAVNSRCLDNGLYCMIIHRSWDLLLFFHLDLTNLYICWHMSEDNLEKMIWLGLISPMHFFFLLDKWSPFDQARHKPFLSLVPFLLLLHNNPPPTHL